jgi:hypothetical protein
MLLLRQRLDPGNEINIQADPDGRDHTDQDSREGTNSSGRTGSAADEEEGIRGWNDGIGSGDCC